MSILKIQIHETTFQRYSSEGYVPENRDEIFKEMPNIFGIANDILGLAMTNMA